MKIIKIVITLLFIAGCSSDNDCQAQKDEINQKYDQLVQQVKDNPEPDGINYRQISFLNEERNKKLEKACD